MLELKAGVPRWYVPSTIALLFLVIVALLITPLRWPYTVGVLLIAAGVLWQVWREEKGRARFTRLRIYKDLSLALVARDGSEIPALGAGQCWVSPWLIVLAVKLSPGVQIRFVFARELNDPDTFRRFTVLCRYGLTELGFAAADAERHNGAGSTTTGA